MDFRQIYEQEVSCIWSYLRKLGVPASDIEDLVHEVFVVVYKRLDDYDPSRPLRPWLLGITVRVASSYRQRAHVRREVARADFELTASDQRGHDDVVATKRAQEAIQAAFALLPVEQQAVFVLHDVDGYTMPEVAEIVQAPLATAYSRLRLARQRLSKSLQHLRSGAGGKA